MTSESHDRDDPSPVTDRLHTNSWSANLEGPQHAAGRALVVVGAPDAIDHTASGYHVNLVTHGDHGHPGTYRFAALEDLEADRAVEWKYVEQCDCGGNVTRVHVG